MAPEEILSDSRTEERAEEYRRRKTTSVLAIVFSDIANSTALREELGEIHYERIREEYDGTFSRIIENDEGGAVVKSTGDGALSVFSEPSIAVERCLRVQQELGGHPHFKLRIGIDMGQVSVKAAQGIVRDVFGRHVNRAARIESLADPGHVLTTFHIFDCAVGWLKGGSIRWHNHGLAELKGFEDLTSIHEPYDTSCSSPQSGKPFRRPDMPMFCRAARRDRPIRLGAAQWSALYEELRTEPVTIRPLTFVDSENPLSDYSSRLATSVQSLLELVPDIPSVLWIGSHPESSVHEHQILTDAGCVLNIAASIEAAQDRLTKTRYFLAILEMGKDQDLAATLALLRSGKAEGFPTPVLGYGSPQAIATYRDQASTEGFLLCAAGSISLLDAINQVLVGLLNRIPREPIDSGLLNHSASIGNSPMLNEPESGGWLDRLRRMFGR